MGIFRKQTARAPVTTVLLVLLLASSIAASSIGFTAWVGAKKQFDEIDSQYTTIAVPSGKNQEKVYSAGSIKPTGIDSIKFPDDTTYIGPLDAENTAKKSEYYRGADHRILLSAHIEGAKNLSSGTFDPLQYNHMLDRYCYTLAVMALRCTYMEETDSYGDERSYWVEFEIVDDVCRIDAYDLPPYEDTLGFESKICTADGEIPFTVGNTYLVRGMYWDYDVRQVREWVTNEEGVEQLVWVPARDTEGVFKSRSLLVDPMYPMMYGFTGETGVTNGMPNWTLEKKQYSNSEGFYWCTPENCWPYYSEYTGDWHDFLETEDGLVWKNEVIPYFEMNHASVSVILTDDIESMYFFNSGDASILEGTLFDDGDYENGNAVCLVSASYAQLNGLSVGDTIELDYYKTGYEQRDYTVLQGSGRNGLTVLRNPLTASTRIDVKKDYTIIGIYTAPEWEAGIHSFHADTIFVPKASVPNADKYAGTSLTMLNSVIIENGSIEAFEAHMSANDKAGAYLYFDQGYTEAAATVQTLIDNAMRLMLVGTAMFLLAAMLFLLLYARRVSAVMRSMRLLGVPKKGVWTECFRTLMAQELIAVLLGNTLAVFLYDWITAQLLSGTPALSVESILLCGGVQLAALLLVGAIWMHTIAGRNLMQNTTANRKIWKTADCGA